MKLENAPEGRTISDLIDKGELDGFIAPRPPPARSGRRVECRGRREPAYRLHLGERLGFAGSSGPGGAVSAFRTFERQLGLAGNLDVPPPTAYQMVRAGLGCSSLVAVVTVATWTYRRPRHTRWCGRDWAVVPLWLW